MPPNGQLKKAEDPPFADTVLEAEGVAQITASSY